MKRLFQILAVTLLSTTSSELCAQHNWAMAFVEKGQDIPTVVEYHSAQETAENGIVYNRIFDGTRLKSKVCWLLISYNTLFFVQHWCNNSRNTKTAASFSEYNYISSKDKVCKVK